jgi:hypothetical protein
MMALRYATSNLKWAIVMLRIFLASLTLAFISRAVASDVAHYIRSNTFEHGDLVAEITDDAMAACPAWDANSDNPPVSAKQAMQVARTVKESLVQDTDEWEWALESASLRQFAAKRQQAAESPRVKKWYWVVVYRAGIKQGGLAGGAPYLEIPVLMDGRAVTPVKQDKDTAKPNRGSRKNRKPR